MVLVVRVTMPMLHHLVQVFMLVAFGQVQSQADCHQTTCHD